MFTVPLEKAIRIPHKDLNRSAGFVTAVAAETDARLRAETDGVERVLLVGFKCQME